MKKLLFIIVMLVTLGCGGTGEDCPDADTLVTLNVQIEAETKLQQGLAKQVTSTSDPVLIHNLSTQISSSLAKEQALTRDREALKASSKCLN